MKIFTGWFDYYGESQGFEPLDQGICSASDVTFVEVMGAQVMVVGTPLQHVEDCSENRDDSRKRYRRREDVVGIEPSLKFSQAGRILAVCCPNLLVIIMRKEVGIATGKRERREG